MIINRHPNCDKCQLFDQCRTPWMKSHGSDSPVILIVGEAPGEDEDKQGRPFVGRSGKLLRETLDAIGVDENDVRFTNVVKCRPPNNVISKKHIELCKHYVLDEIDYYDPKVVLLMGNTPLSAVLGEAGGITTWNGITVERDGTTYAPLFHPAYILRDLTKLPDWAGAMSNAIENAGNGTAHGNYKYPKTVDDFDAMRNALAQSEYISYDVETASLDPFAEHNLLLSVSLSNGDVSYAYPIEHPEANYTDEMLSFVVSITDSILKSHNGKVIGHNVKFDQQQTRQLLGIEFEAGGDSMLLSCLMDSRAGLHGLKRLAGMYLGMFDYDAGLRDYIKTHKEANVHKGGTYAAVPLKILLPYGAMDADATYRLYWKLYEDIPDDMLAPSELTIAASNALANVEYNGAAVDAWIAARYDVIYSIVQKHMFEVLSKDKHVKRMVADKQAEWDATINLKKKTRQIFTFNPNSPDQVQELYFQRYKIPVIAHNKSGKPSTESKIMKAVSGKYPIVEQVRKYKLVSKMRGTYLKPAAYGGWWSGDGRVRSYYNLNGTVTGRLASSQPNLQNIPTPEKEHVDGEPTTIFEALPIKNVFTHSYWGDECIDPRLSQRNHLGQYPQGVLMSVDYSGMELRVFASVANCQSMIGIHKSGADFHSMVAIMSITGRDVYDITKDEANKFKEEQVAVRYRYKWTNWTLLYGGDWNTLVNLYKIPKAEAQQTVKQYYTKFPEVLEYRKWCEEFAVEHGYIQSPLGRRELLPYIRGGNRGEYNKSVREAVNMPVQSAASDVLLCSLIIIDKELRRREMQTKLVNTVHDSLVLDVPYHEIDDVAAMCVDIMENIIQWSEKYLSFMDFSWLICPLKADVDVGTHYGGEAKYKSWKNGEAVL